MINIRKISPMARAIGTMGVVAGLVGAVTFANLTSNTVALTPNNIATASAELVINNDNSCDAGSPTSVIGFQVAALAPGGSATKNFCLFNSGDIPLDISASIPDVLGGSTAAVNTTLDIVCTSIGTTGPALLHLWGSPQTFTLAALPVGVSEACIATVTLSNSYSGPGGETIPPFTINFTGTQVAI